MMKALAVALIALPILVSSLRAETQADPNDRVVIVADTPKMTRWAVIHQAPDPAHNDPYFHLEAFEHKKGAKPWVFRRLAHHMVITSEALEKAATRNALEHMRIRMSSSGSRIKSGATIPKAVHKRPSVRRISKTALNVPQTKNRRPI